MVTAQGCWDLWRQRQTLAGSDTDTKRAVLALQIHLERIVLHRPLSAIEDLDERKDAEQLRRWFAEEFINGPVD